jgi:hypothetical protein
MGARRRRRLKSREFVYRSTYLHEADLVANELEGTGIAFYRAEEGPAGVRWAMPLSPAWQPGTYFLIIVPAPHAALARRLIESLPVSQDEYPDLWPPGTKDDAKKFWRWWAWVTILGVSAGVLFSILEALRP